METDNKSPSRTKPIVVVLANWIAAMSLLGIFGAILVMGLTSNSVSSDSMPVAERQPPPSPSVDAEMDEEAARPFVQICAEDQVREMLKAPSTAKFSWSPDISKWGRNYAVISYVDAENSFGATLRQNWQCRVILGQAGNALNDCVATCTFSEQ